MWFVYVIKSDVDNRLYKGMSQDISSRLQLHDAGKVSSTKAYRPWKLVYSEECGDAKQARQREIFLKSSFGRAFLKTLDL
jgi:putative endonuclease